MIVFVLLALSIAGQQNPPPKPKGTFDEPGSGSPRQFHSVGVHGTIDAGGYAASASAKTQTDFFEQLTALQVAALRAAWASPDSCASLPVLQKPVELLSRGEFTAAAAALEKLLPANHQPAVRQLLGLAYEGLGRCGAAAEQFAATPPDEADLFAQSAALLLEGNVPQAEAVARKAAANNPDPGSLGRLSLGAGLFERGDITQALSLFLDAAGARPFDLVPFEFIVIAIRSASPVALSNAVALLTSFAQRSPDNAGPHYALACALSAAAGGPTARIESELKHALMLDPHLADAHFRLAALYADGEDLSPAIDEYRAALAVNPRLIEAHYRLGQLYTRHGDLQLAKEQLDLHQQLRARQKSDIENGRVPVQLPDLISCVR